MKVCGLDGCDVDISDRLPHTKFCHKRHGQLHREAYIGKRRKVYSATYYAKNAEDRKQYAREHRAANPEAHAARHRNWAAANREIRMANVNRHSRLRRARLASSVDSVSVSERDWLRLVRRYDGRCAYCGIKPLNPVRDHVVPIVRGGRESVGNLLPACGPCNGSKGSKLLVVWRRDLANRRVIVLGWSWATGTRSIAIPATGR